MKIKTFINIGVVILFPVVPDGKNAEPTITLTTTAIVKTRTLWGAILICGQTCSIISVVAAPYRYDDVEHLFWRYFLNVSIGSCNDVDIHFSYSTNGTCIPATAFGFVAYKTTIWKNNVHYKSVV